MLCQNGLFIMLLKKKKSNVDILILIIFDFEVFNFQEFFFHNFLEDDVSFIKHDSFIL